MMGWSRDAGEGRRAGPRSCGRCGGADARAGTGSRAPAEGWRAPSPPCKRPRTPSGSAYPLPPPLTRVRAGARPYALRQPPPRRETDPSKHLVITGMGLVSVFGTDVGLL